MKTELNKLLTPAFPAVPSQNSFNQLIAVFPGQSKLEYYSFEILQYLRYSNNDNELSYVELIEESLQQAKKFIEEYDKYVVNLMNENKSSELISEDGKIIKI